MGNKLLVKVIMLATENGMYFVSEREIKEGDWLYGSDENRIVKAEKTAEWLNQVMDKRNPNWFKIEATTDVSLHLPLIREQFIRQYVESQGAIKEVYLKIGDISPVGYNDVIMGVLSDCGYVVIAKEQEKTDKDKFTDNQLAVKVVEQILFDLKDRSGLQNSWDGIDNETQLEIEKTWIEIVERALEYKN